MVLQDPATRPLLGERSKVCLSVPRRLLQRSVSAERCGTQNHPFRPSGGQPSPKPCALETRCLTTIVCSIRRAGRINSYMCVLVSVSVVSLVHESVLYAGGEGIMDAWGGLLHASRLFCGIVVDSCSRPSPPLAAREAGPPPEGHRGTRRRRQGEGGLHRSCYDRRHPHEMPTMVLPVYTCLVELLQQARSKSASDEFDAITVWPPPLITRSSFRKVWPKCMHWTHRRIDIYRRTCCRSPCPRSCRPNVSANSSTSGARSLAIAPPIERQQS